MSCTMSCEGFDLILAFDEAHDVTFDSGNVSAFDEMDCSDPLNMSGRCDMHRGMKVEMHSHNLKMRKVVKIIVALQRMKHFKQRSSEFGDDELLSVIMENVIEERRANFDKAGLLLTKTDRVLQCSVCDQLQKYLVQSGGAPNLQAVTLRGGNKDKKVLFNLSSYVTPNPIRTDSQPVCLGISKSNLYLACSKLDQSKPPTLVLKEVNQSLNTIEVDDPKGYDQLLFYRKQTASSFNTFESVKFPGWFISTAYDDSERVDMCQKSDDRIQNFSLIN